MLTSFEEETYVHQKSAFVEEVKTATPTYVVEQQIEWSDKTVYPLLLNEPNPTTSTTNKYYTDKELEKISQNTIFDSLIKRLENAYKGKNFSLF